MSVFHHKMMSFHTGRYIARAFWVALVVKNPPASAGDVSAAGSIPGWERSPGGGHGNPLRYSCLENPRQEEPGGLHSKGLQESDTTEGLSLHTSLVRKS